MAAEEEYIGSVSEYAGFRVPRGFMRCEGQEVNINQYTALYSIIGNLYGGDPSRGKFNLPDLRPSPAGWDPKKPVKLICVEGLYPPFD